MTLQEFAKVAARERLEEKTAGVIGRKIRGKLYGEHKELQFSPHTYTSKKKSPGKKRLALFKIVKRDKKGNLVKD